MSSTLMKSAAPWYSDAVHVYEINTITWGLQPAYSSVNVCTMYAAAKIYHIVPQHRHDTVLMVRTSFTVNVIVNQYKFL